MSSILRKNIFDEVTQPSGLFESADLMAICHGYLAQFRARHVELNKTCVSLYDKASLALVGHFDCGRHPINDIAFHPDKPQILIGSGSYDGGYLFEGELVLWNYENNDYLSLLKEEREVTSCRFVEDGIEFTINPQDDSNEGSNDFIDETYFVSLQQMFPVHLMECQKISVSPHCDSLYDEAKRPALVQRLKDIATMHGKTYQVTALAWDMVFVDAHTLCVALSDGIIEIWDLKQLTCQRISLAERGHCTQIFHDVTLHLLTVVIFNSHYQEDKHTSIFQIQLPSLQFKRVFAGNVVLSKNQQGAFLGRQINFVNKTEKDRFFSPTFENTLERRFGHYDLFNHYIRIDNHEHFFALVGNPTEQHTHKELLEIDAVQGRVIERYPIDPTEGHYMNLNAILLGDRFIFQAKVYNSNPRNKKYILFAINRFTKITEWLTELPAQVCAFCTSSHEHQVIISLTNGDVIVVNIASGRKIQHLNKSNQHGVPLSLTRYEEKLAIGYDDGSVEVFAL